MLILQIILLLAAIGYLIFLYSNRNVYKTKFAKAENDLAIAKNELAHKEGKFSAIESEIFGLINNEFSEQMSEDIRNGFASVGMPSKFLSMTWGHPQKIVINEKDNSIESWYYRDPDNKQDKQTEVVIQNNKIISLKDI